MSQERHVTIVDCDTVDSASPGPRKILGYLCSLFTCLAVFVVSPQACCRDLPRSSGLIEVDFNQPAGPLDHMASGFLHAISPSRPSDAVLSEIKVKAIRAAPFYISNGEPCFTGNPSYFQPLDPAVTCSATRQPGAWDRITALNPRPVLIANIAFASDKVAGRDSYWPADDGYRIWDGIVDQVVRTSLSWGYRGAFSTWNEPDINFKKHGGWLAYKRAYATAVRRIRSICPSCRIVGPEISTYDFSLLTDFLYYARRNNVFPDVLDWHELTDTPSAIRSHVSEIKSWMAAQGMPAIPVYVTEYGTRSAFGRPGDTATFIANLENSGADLAIRANWIQKHLNLSGNLPGAVAIDGTRLTMIGQVYRHYDEMSGTKIAAKASAAGNSAQVAALASRDDQRGAAWVMVGRRGKPHAMTDFAVTLNHVPDALVSGGLVDVELVVITDPQSPILGVGRFVAAPAPSVVKTRVQVSGGRASIKVSVGPWGAAFLRLTRPAAIAGRGTPKSSPF